MRDDWRFMYLWALVERCAGALPTAAEWEEIKLRAEVDRAECEAEAEDWLRHAVARLENPNMGTWRAEHRATRERVEEVNRKINQQRAEARAVHQQELFE